MGTHGNLKGLLKYTVLKLGIRVKQNFKTLSLYKYLDESRRNYQTIRRKQTIDHSIIIFIAIPCIL